jgi:hypothetical protein
MTTPGKALVRPEWKAAAANKPGLEPVEDAPASTPFGPAAPAARGPGWVSGAFRRLADTTVQVQQPALPLANRVITIK